MFVAIDAIPVTGKGACSKVADPVMAVKAEAVTVFEAPAPLLLTVNETVMICPVERLPVGEMAKAVTKRPPWGKMVTLLLVIGLAVALMEG